MKRKKRVIKLQKYDKTAYIKHLGQKPYNEIKFDCGRYPHRMLQPYLLAQCFSRFSSHQQRHF